MKARWIMWRNGLLGSGRFRSVAARVPLIRGVARARAGEAFDLVAGFVYSQVLAAAVESGLLDRLAEGPVGEDALATACDLSSPATRRLLRAAAALGLAEETRAGWLLGPKGVAIQGDPGVVAMIRHHRHLYADLADPMTLLRREGGAGALSAYWPYAEGRDGAVSDYSALMAASQPMVAEQAIAAYDFGRHHRMLDVGGGQGAFVAAVGRVAPKLHRAVFDLPEVVTRIVDPAVERFPGSFVTDPLPHGFDLITLVRVLHDHDDEKMLHIVRAAKSALEPGGKLLIVEPMAGVRGAEAMADAYFGMYLLAMGSGRARTHSELEAVLVATGFRGVRRLRTPYPVIASALVCED